MKKTKDARTMAGKTDPQQQPRNSATQRPPDIEEREKRATELFAELRERKKQAGAGDLQWLYEVRSNCFLPEHDDLPANVDDPLNHAPESTE